MCLFAADSQVYNLTVPTAGPHCQNEHLLPMKMRSVPEVNVVIHHDADAFVFGKVVDVSLGIEGGAGGCREGLG